MGSGQGLKRVCENRKETADLSTPLRSGRDDKFVEPWMGVHPLDDWQLPCNKFVISTGGIMGLWPTQGDEKTPRSSNHSLWNRPFLCHPEQPTRGGELRDE